MQVRVEVDLSGNSAASSPIRGWIQATGDIGLGKKKSMVNFSRRLSLPALVGALLIAIPGLALAINGMYLAGYGNESILMGGADVAVARDAFAATNNPSGMTQLTKQAADAELALENDIDISHTDSFGNYRKPRADHYSVYGNAAYARRFENTPYAAGVALVVQGGIGWTYRGLNTQFGTRDDASALFAVVKLAPAVAWKVNDDLSLGVMLGINYFGGSQEFFPNTACSVCLLGGPFNGFRFKGASGIGLSSKWGLQYHPAPDVTIGVTYGTQTSIPMKNGNLRINLSNTPLGVVRYDNAKLEGFRLPEELAVGLSFRPTSSLLVSLEDKWYNWTDALNNLQITATNPRTPGAPAKIVIPSTAGFVDQHVLAAGLAWDFSEKTVVLAGLNYGVQPIQGSSLNPVFAPIPSRHVMLGFNHNIDAEWQWGAGWELYLPQRATYSNAVFGTDASERNITSLFHFAVSRRW